jgi:hypothetical protein
MQSSPLQASYRAIFTEMLLAQAAAVNTFADIAGRCARVAREQQAAARNNQPKAASAGQKTQGVPRATDVARALAVLPRVSMILFLSHYDNLRRQHGAARD